MPPRPGPYAGGPNSGALAVLLFLLLVCPLALPASGGWKRGLVAFMLRRRLFLIAFPGALFVTASIVEKWYGRIV